MIFVRDKTVPGTSVNAGPQAGDGREVPTKVAPLPVRATFVGSFSYLAGCRCLSVAGSTGAMRSRTHAHGGLAAAGPLLVVVLLQRYTRPSVDPRVRSLGLLSRGDRSWMQMTNSRGRRRAGRWRHLESALALHDLTHDASHWKAHMEVT